MAKIRKIEKRTSKREYEAHIEYGDTGGYNSKVSKFYVRVEEAMKGIIDDYFNDDSRFNEQQEKLSN